jgi:hypothetical protein
MIIRLWRGEIALWKSFWLFGVGGGALIGLPIFATMLALTDVPDDTTASIFVFALGFLLAYLIWVFVGIWRAANSYSGNRTWSIFAKVAVAAEVLQIVLLVAAVLFADVG